MIVLVMNLIYEGNTQVRLSPSFWGIELKLNNLFVLRSVSDKRMSDFFRNNFQEDRWRKAALKNAFALLGRQRFMHAAAFFLLGGALHDAVEVCICCAR